MEIREAYKVMQAASGIEVGDTVKVLRTAKGAECGWDNSWVRDMDKSIGKSMVVMRIASFYGIELKDGNNRFTYPFYVLEIIKKKQGDGMTKLEEAYKVMQAAWVKENNVQVGDTVVAMRHFKEHEMGCSCCETQSRKDDPMGRCVDDGAIAIITHISSQNMRLDFGPKYAGTWSFPFFVLKIVGRKKEEKMVEIGGKKWSEATIAEALRKHAE